MDEQLLLRKRFVELAKKSYNNGIYLYTDFLGLMEQSLFEEIKNEISGIPYTLFGGAEGAERVMIGFGSQELCGYSSEFPISLIKAEPISPKFADKLTHRDFLGAIMNLGISRETVGDIIIKDNIGYIFVSLKVCDFVMGELTRVKKTDLKLSLITSIPSGELFSTQQKRIQVSGERLDAVIAKAYNLSREKAQDLFVKKLIFADGKQITSPSYRPKVKEIISVRGYGRFSYEGDETKRKKGKQNILINIYT